MREKKDVKTRAAIVLPDFSGGGAQMMVSRLASHLDPEKAETEVICVAGKARHNGMEQAVLDHGIPIVYIEKGTGFSVSAIARLFRELNRFGPDVVHTHLSACVYCAPWVIAKGRKMLHTVHNVPERELIRPKRILMRMMYRTGRAVPVAISGEIQKMTKQFYGLRRDPELVYNPVDTARFAVSGREAHDSFVILSVGRLSAQKNQQLLIRAFSNLHRKNDRAELYILGEGPMRSELEKLIGEEGLEDCVHLEGNVPDPERYYSRADVFAMSSAYEGLPLVLLEAMAASLPVVSTDVGGVRDIVSDNGILVREGDGQALEEALWWMMEHPSERRVMGERSRNGVQKYDSEVIAGEYTELYRKYGRKRNDS